MKQLAGFSLSIKKWLSHQGVDNFVIKIMVMTEETITKMMMIVCMLIVITVQTIIMTTRAVSTSKLSISSAHNIHSLEVGYLASVARH